MHPHCRWQITCLHKHFFFPWINATALRNIWCTRGMLFWSFCLLTFLQCVAGMVISTLCPAAQEIAQPRRHPENKHGRQTSSRKYSMFGNVESIPLPKPCFLPNFSDKSLPNPGFSDSCNYNVRPPFDTVAKLVHITPISLWFMVRK